MAHAAEVRVHLLLGLVSHRAGIEDDDIGLFWTLGALGALRRAQHVRDLVRVVLVHLAAEGAKEKLRHQRRSCCAASCGERSHSWPIMPSPSRRYFTGAPGRTATGSTTRLSASRICAPGASLSRLPSTCMVIS